MPPWRQLPVHSRFLRGSDFVAAPEVRRSVFLDRDNVISDDVHFLTAVEHLRILPGVVGALRLLQEHFYLVVVTNQSGIARGLLTEGDLVGIHAELVRRLKDEGAHIDAIYYCPHLPEASVPGYGGECDCRKPKPGMLLRAARDWRIDLPTSFMIGDQARDVEAGRAANVRSILLGDRTAPNGDWESAQDLAHAVQIILESSGYQGASSD